MTFFSPDSQYLYDDLVLLPQEGAKTGGTGRPPNSYALLFDGYSILFDAPFRYVLGEVDDLAKRGHPPGALVLSHRDLLLTGDSAVAPGPRQDEEPPRLERPLGPSQAMTDELADEWRSFDRPLRTICPLHGVPYVDRDDLGKIMRTLYEAEPMNPAGR